MKIRSIRKILAAAVLASVLTWAPQAALTAAHEQPAHGLILTDEVKQAYITEKMQAFFHPAPDAAPPAFELPDGWTIAHERINGVTVDRITPAEERSDRVLLQLHGGGYIMALTVYPGMPHDFALLFPELEDSVQSLQEIADFVNRYMD